MPPRHSQADTDRQAQRQAEQTRLAQEKIEKEKAQLQTA